MVESEQEMVRKLDDAEVKRETVLQATYEDSIPPDPDDWEIED